MSYIYGIVNISGRGIDNEYSEALLRAFYDVDFESNTIYDNFFFCGFAYRKDRKCRAGIFNDQTITVIADIRIYNSEALKNKFDFTTPEEALAKAYINWGVDCGKYINGDFSAVIIDKKKKAIHLIRDHIGVRPLTYCLSGSNLIFASNEFGIAKSEILTVSLSEDELIRQLLRSKKEVYEQTIFKEIKKVLPGSILTLSQDEVGNYKGRVSKHIYWVPSTIVKNKCLTYEESVAKLRELLIKAVKNRMEKVPMALHVSGGIDSTGIASIVADLSEDKSILTGYSYAPEQFNDKIAGINEKEFIEEFVKDKGVRVKYQIYNGNEVMENMVIPEFGVQHIELPLMKKAAQDNAEIVFSGWGGDEFLSLSTRGIVNYLFFMFKWRRLFGYIRRTGLINVTQKFFSEVFPLFIPFGWVNPYKLQRMDWKVLKVLRNDFIIRNFTSIVFNRKRNIFGYGKRMRFILNLLENRHLARRMDCMARNGEKYGLEYRYPLLDKELLEFWFSIPVKYTYKDFTSRLLYRDIMKGIMADKIRNRKEKSDTVFETFSIKNKQQNMSVFIDCFKSIKEEDHLPYFNIKYLRELTERLYVDKSVRSRKDLSYITIYLRCVNLAKKYNVKTI